MRLVHTEEVTDNIGPGLTTKSDHNDMRFEAIRTDTWIGQCPGKRLYRTSWAYLTSKGSRAHLGTARLPGDQVRLVHDQMGEIWEITSRVNVPESLSTELKKSI
jgi:hypothetical protein